MFGHVELFQKLIKSYSIDKITFLISFCTVIGIASFILLSTDFAKTIIGEIYSFVVDYFGSYYLILTIFSFLFLLILSVSKYGQYVLGGKESSPEFSYMSWIGMLFC